MRKLPFLIFFGLTIAVSVYLYVTLTSKNLSIKTNVDDAQIRFRLLDEPMKSKKSEIYSKSYNVLGRTPFEGNLEPGTYAIIVSKSGHIPVVETIKIGDENVEKTFFLAEGFRFVNGRTFEWQGNERKVKDFFLAEKETTNREYIQFCEATGHPLPIYIEDPRFNGKEHPVIGISFDDAKAFAQWKSEISGLTYRLPYEYEWVLAATNGDLNRVYPWGVHETTTSTYLANYHPFDVIQNKLLPKEIDGHMYTSPVGSYPRTDKKFYDLAGNVFEWCLDDVNLRDNEDYNLDISIINHARVVKGGSWNFNQFLLHVKSRVYVDGRIAKGYNGIRLLVEFN